MTAQIASETIAALGVDATGFARLVHDRLETLREYDAHEATVRRHAADPDMKPEARWVTLAVPQAPATVDSAIRATTNPDGTHAFDADYEIIPPSLEKRKVVLFDRVNEAEIAAIKIVLAPGKVRAYQLREKDIREADDVRMTAELAKGIAGIQNVPAFLENHRPAEDTKFLAEQAAREALRQKIYRWAANLHSEIEDLTDATVDAWEMKPFHAGD